MKVLMFRLFGDYGHYRPYYTTSSPTTYSFMPPATVIGLIGGILGLDRSEYYEILTKSKIKVGIGLEAPVKKMTFSTNLINTKGDYWVPTQRNANGPRTPTRYEYVKDPDYMIYVTMEEEELLDTLAQRVRSHCPVYSISLGLAGLLGDIEFITYSEPEYREGDNDILLDTAVPLSALKDVDGFRLMENTRYCREQYVSSFEGDRVPASYVDVLFSPNQKQIMVKPKGFYHLNGKNFVFLNG